MLQRLHPKPTCPNPTQQLVQDAGHQGHYLWEPPKSGVGVVLPTFWNEIQSLKCVDPDYSPPFRSLVQGFLYSKATPNPSDGRGGERKS